MAAGALTEPLARIKVDEKNCFGMIEWRAVREVASRLLLKHTPAAAWKRRDLSHVEHEGLPSMPKVRGAEKRRCRRPAGVQPGLKDGGGGIAAVRRLSSEDAWLL